MVGALGGADMVPAQNVRDAAPRAHGPIGGIRAFAETRFYYPEHPIGDIVRAP